MSLGKQCFLDTIERCSYEVTVIDSMHEIKPDKIPARGSAERQA